MGLTSLPTKAKHQRIADQLLSEIEAGRWRPGSQLPSEGQLAIETRASLGTVQRALRNLVEIGVVERHHGRGTFVSGARAPERHLRNFRFVAHPGGPLLPVYFHMLDVDITTEPGPWKEFLAAPDDRFFRMRRVVSVNNEFDIFSEVYLSATRFPEVAQMTREKLDGVSIRDMLAERFNAPTLNTQHTMMCQVLPPRVTGEIGVPVGQYGIVWTIGNMSYRDIPITWQRIFLPPSDRVLQVLPRPPSEVPVKTGIGE